MIAQEKADTGGEICPLDYDLFIGMDVSKRSIAVTVLDHRRLIQTFQTEYSGKNVLGYVRNRYEGKRVAYVYEAGPTGFGLHDELRAAGEKCLVAAANMIPKKPGDRVKTNRKDSLEQAKALRGGEIEGIRVPSTAYRHLRHLTQLRGSHADQIGRTKLRIKALLLYEGIEFPGETGKVWTKGVLGELGKIPCAEAVRFKLQSLIETLKFHGEQAKGAIREIGRLCRENEEMEASMGYLTSLPGVGRVVASSVLGRIGDPGQLRNADELGDFFGLVPCENSTGEDVDRGHITHKGDSRVRSMLIEAAWRAIRIDPELKEFFDRVKRNHSKEYATRTAIVAVARKLTRRIYAVLKERRNYEIRTK